MESEESFISSDKDVYEGKFWSLLCVCVHVCVRVDTHTHIHAHTRTHTHTLALSFGKLTHHQGYYIACNDEIELKGLLF